MKNVPLLTALQNKKIFIISPHFDDAILSCGMLMYELRGKAKVTVVNVFTKAHKGPYTFSGKHFLKTAGFMNAVAMYKTRNENDKRALSLVKADSINIAVTDALFRKKTTGTFLGKFAAEFDHVYPTYRWHIQRATAKKDYAVEMVEKKLKKIISQNAVVIAPFGIGSHVDHVILSNLCSKLFADVVYYIDFPYTIRLHNYGTPPQGYKAVALKVDLAVKNKLIRAYTSQVNVLFEKGIVPKHTEKFFVKNGVLA